MKDHYLTIDGHTIVAHEYNPDAKTVPLVFIHGINGIIYFWKPMQPPTILQEYNWFTLSLPGHYPASLPDDFQEQLTPEMIGNILSQALQQLLGDEAAIIIGHSTGGFAAFCIAHHAPNLVKQLVIVDGFVNGYWRGTLRISQMIANLPVFAHELFRLNFWLGTFNYSIFKAVYLSYATDKKAVKAFPDFEAHARESFEYASQHNASSLEHYYRVMPSTDITNWLSSINKPVNIIHGTEDGIILPSHAEHLHTNLSNNTLTWIDGSGHLPMLERPQAYQNALMSAILESP